MRKKKKDYPTIIGPNCDINKNSIKSSDSIQIDGSFFGNIECQEEVFIGINGYVDGKIKSNHVSISGTFKGTIKARGCIYIAETGNLEGSISCKSIIIDDGGILNGSTNMSTDETADDIKAEEEEEENA